MDHAWGAETEKAIANFPISGERVPASVIRWLARVKAEVARANGALGVVDADRAQRIARVADAIAAGAHADQFPVDVFQTGSGTSTNMNMNEVIATLAGADVHPNDHVNAGQSSNDVFPTAVHLAAAEALVADLDPALAALAASLGRRAAEHDDVVKPGRTHLMDAVPITLGQELRGWAAQVRAGRERISILVPRLCRVPLGGTAVGTGLNAHPLLAERVRAALAAASALPVAAPLDPFEAQGARDGLVEASGVLRTVALALAKIASDLRLLASGPATGFGEIVLPELQKGSSIMPGKVNPVIPEVVIQVACQVVGNDAAVGAAAFHAQLELAAVVPVLARNVLQSIHLLTTSARALGERCIDGLRADRARCLALAEATLASATPLARHVGYDRAAELVAAARGSGRSLAEVARAAGLDPDILHELDPLAIARGGRR